jgi:undecaprenyl-diphosphatase
MDFLKAIILGLVQGLTEFIPISSSGHLVLSKHFLNFGESTDISFEIFVHLGSMIAVLVFFRREIYDLILSVVHYKNPKFAEGRKIVLWLFVATVVTGVFGIVFKGFFETLFNPIFSAITIGITGFILYFSDKISEKNLDISQLNINKSLMIGLAQAIAITPGISRSGTTITAGILTGLKRKQAATFSFLLSIPAILGAHVTDIKKFLDMDSSQLLIYLTGFAMAGISGYLVIRWLIKIIEKAKLRYFAYYCWGIAVICIVLLMFL